MVNAKKRDWRISGYVQGTCWIFFMKTLLKNQSFLHCIVFAPLYRSIDYIYVTLLLGYFVPLVCFSIHLPIPHCLDYWGLVASLRVTVVLSFWPSIKCSDGHSVSFTSLNNFRNSWLISASNFWDNREGFHWSLGQSGKSCILPMLSLPFHKHGNLFFIKVCFALFHQTFVVFHLWILYTF